MTNDGDGGTGDGGPVAGPAWAGEPGATTPVRPVLGKDDSFDVWGALESWSRQLASWQKWILAHAIDHRTLSPSEVDAAYRLLFHATGLGTSDDAPLPSVPTIQTRPTVTAQERWLLKEIRELQNVNAIPRASRLPLGTALTVVYGKNGAGKSGFARLLSTACFSRGVAEVLPNVHDESDGKARIVDAVIELNGPGGDEVITLTGSPNHRGLKSFTVLDTHAARSQISEDNVVTFTPAGMDVFREMSRVYSALQSRLKEEVSQRSVAFDFPGRLGLPAQQTVTAATLVMVEHSLDLSQIRAAVTTAEQDRRQLDACQKEIVELTAMGVAALRQRALRHRSSLENLRARVLALRAVMGSEVREKLNRQIRRLAECLAAAATESAEAFRRQGLHAVGSPEWSAFVASAHSLAEIEGAHAPYPNAQSPCLLCQRPLDEPSVDLLRRLWTFLKAPARSEIQELTRSLDRALSETESARTDLLPSDSAVRVQLSEAQPGLLVDLESLLRSLEDLRLEMATSLRDRVPIGNWDHVGSSPMDALDAEIARLISEEGRLATADPRRRLDDLREQEIELEARLALGQLLQELQDFVHSEQWCRRAKQVVASDLNTRAVSAKEQDIFQRVVEGAYLKRLKAECDALGCSVPQLETRGQKGQTYRTLRVGRYEPHRVLSEGEQRALAVADCLTEVGLNSSSGGIILDDPVTSMDHERKRAIAARLVEEARLRQVVIFTHDLVFLDQLLRCADDNSVGYVTHWIERSADGQPGHVIHDDHPACSKNYETTGPAEKALERARKALGSARELELRDGAGKLRQTLEEIVLKHLFKSTVSRWEERIKIANIRNVAWSNDVADEIYATFEELSRMVVGHSHSDAHDAPPEPTDLQRMIAKVQALVSKAKGRR